MKNLITYLPKKSLSLDNASRMNRDWIGNSSVWSRKFFALLVVLLIGVEQMLGVEIYSNAGAAVTSGVGTTTSGTTAVINETAGNGNPAPSWGMTSSTRTTLTLSNFAVTSYSGRTLSVDAAFKSFPSTTNTWPYVTVTLYKNSVSVYTNSTTIKWSSKDNDYDTYTFENLPDFDKIVFVHSPASGKSKAGNATTSYACYLDNIIVSGTAAPSCATAPTVGAPSNSSVSVNTATVSCSDGITKGSCDISEYGFYYGTTNGVTTSNAAKHKVGDGTAGNNVSSYSWDMTSLTANTHYYVKAYAIAGGTTTLSTNQTDFTTCKVAAPNHVEISAPGDDNYGWRYTTGETLKLTATAYSSAGTGSPIAAENITGYQWQKYVDDDWSDLADGGSISGATSATLQISSLTTANGGSYRCKVSTGSSCSTYSKAGEGYQVYIFTLDGNYSGSDWTKNAITWTGENTGTVTKSLNASSIYTFKVTDNDGGGQKWYGSGSGNYIIESGDSKDCGTGNSDIRLFTGPAGNYTFTIDITHSHDGSPYVNVVTTYPSVTHPVTGYMYVPKWWTCYPHWWDGSGNVLTDNGYDPEITKYTEICDEDYWYMPVLATYTNVAVKDNATWASASNNSGNQTTTDHSGMMLTNDGSWKWQSFTTYTITYAKGDGTGDAMATSSGICPSADQDLTANSYTAPSHKHFSGWKTNTALTYVAYGDDDDGTHKVAVAVNGIVPDRAKIKEVGGNITLTAQWAYNTTTVTLKKNGGTGNNQTVLATYGSAMPLTTTSDVAIAVHTKAGYALSGYWDTDASTGGNQYYSYDGSTLSSCANWDKDDASIDLYARWEEKVDQFIDDLHETSGYTSASPHEESGAGYTMPEPLANGDKTTGNDCRKAHYVFVGWVISGGQNANGTIKGTPKIWQPGESNNASGATYYAVWAEE